MTVPEIWRGQNRGGKKKRKRKRKNERDQNHIASPRRIANYKKNNEQNSIKQKMLATSLSSVVT